MERAYDDDLIAALRALPARRTLDLECGDGELTQHLPGEVMGVDRSARNVSAAKERGVHAIVGNPLVLPPSAHDRLFTAGFYGRLGEADRATLRALPGDELVVVEPKGAFTAEALAAELGGERAVLHDGPHFVAVSSTRRS